MTHKDFAKVSHSCINSEYLAKDSKSTHSMLMHTENSKYATTEIWNIWNDIKFPFPFIDDKIMTMHRECSKYSTPYASASFTVSQVWCQELMRIFPQAHNIQKFNNFQEFNILMQYVSLKASCLLSFKIVVDSRIFVLHLPGS